MNLLRNATSARSGHAPLPSSDPFDRLIICQAMAENMPVCTGDNHFADYGIQQVWQMPVYAR